MEKLFQTIVLITFSLLSKLALIQSNPMSRPVENVVTPTMVLEHLLPSPTAISGSEQNRDANKTTSLSNQPYHIRVYASDAGLISDSEGNITGDIYNGWIVQNISDVDYSPSGDHSFRAVIPSDKTYTVTFKAEDIPIDIEIKQYGSGNVNRQLRYQDIVIPQNTNVELVLGSGGAIVFRYDADNDEIVDTELSPTHDVIGENAQDEEPPVITFSTRQEGNNTIITIDAIDEGSGVAAIRYSLDGKQFPIYERPFTIEGGNIQTVYAMADDLVGNRSGIYEYTNRDMYLPFINR